MKRLLALSVFIFIAVFIGKVYAPDEQKIKVCLSVKCDDDDTESFIKSYIRRELRGLRDVEIVNIERRGDEVNSWKNGWDSGRFDLSILAMKIETTELVCIHHIFQERFNHLNIKAEIKNRFYDAGEDMGEAITRLEEFESSLSEKQKTEFSALTLFLLHRGFVNNSGLVIVGKDRLKDECKRIVVAFDTNVLERVRKIR